ncbi:MAG: hypothetical protein J6V25_00640 [Oscillospiraceae bacterium]|nr:hypothetical protein [Oscillospiraceae bacterium]
MKRSVMLVILIVMLSICLTACGCEHEWKDATCLAPKTCSLCEETEGELADHQWQNATCTAAKTCSVCNATEGEALGHVWQDATCTEAKTCSVCKETEGDALGHNVDTWTVVLEASCAAEGYESGVCGVCNETITMEIPLLDHTPGEWKVTIEATAAQDGMEVLFCSVCEAELETRTFELPPFDYSKLKNKWRFSYDDFDQYWKYYAQYDKPYSDADEFVNIIVFSEDGGGGRVEDFEIRAGMSWKDSSKEDWVVERVEVLVNGKIYSFEMTKSSRSSFSYAILYNETSYQFIQDMAVANKVKIKIYYEDQGSTEMDLGSNPFKNFCKDIVDYNVWAYYTPSSDLAERDHTTVR